DLRSPIPKASTRQLHITDNFTLVEQEFRSFLECGIPSYGFVRVHCDSCGRDRVVAFSCRLSTRVRSGAELRLAPTWDIASHGSEIRSMAIVSMFCNRRAVPRSTDSASMRM